nr:hypothetical protein [Campylobacter sp.]
MIKFICHIERSEISCYKFVLNLDTSLTLSHDEKRSILKIAVFFCGKYSRQVV